MKVRWSREEEFRHGYVRPAAVIDIRVGAGRDGRLTAWQMTNLNSGSFGLAGPYEVPNQRLDYQAADSPLRQGSYRGLAATANHFARESAMDEAAVALEIDPLELGWPVSRQAPCGRLPRSSRADRLDPGAAAT